MPIYHIFTTTPMEESKTIDPNETPEKFILYAEHYIEAKSILAALNEIIELQDVKNASEIWGKESKKLRISPHTKLTNKFPAEQHETWKTWQLFGQSENKYTLLHEGKVSIQNWFRQREEYRSNLPALQLEDREPGWFWRLFGSRKS